MPLRQNRSNSLRTPSKRPDKYFPVYIYPGGGPARRPSARKQTGSTPGALCAVHSAWRGLLRENEGGYDVDSKRATRLIHSNSCDVTPRISLGSRKQDKYANTAAN